MVAIETILRRTMLRYTIVQKSAGPYEQAAAAGNWDRCCEKDTMPHLLTKTTMLVKWAYGKYQTAFTKADRVW